MINFLACVFGLVKFNKLVLVAMIYKLRYQILFYKVFLYCLYFHSIYFIFFYLVLRLFIPHINLHLCFNNYYLLQFLLFALLYFQHIKYDVIKLIQTVVNLRSIF